MDIVIVATRAGALPAPTGQLWQWPEMRAELDRVGVQSLADLQSRLIGDSRILGPLFGAVPVPANSDYFPFVDLNAPRLRFMGANAFELPRLTTVSVPVVDFLRTDAAPAPTAQPSEQSGLARDGFVRRALALRRALAGARLDDLDTLAASTIVVLRTTAAQCDDPQVQAAWKTAARNVGTLTAPYLSPAELADVWTRIRATPCYRDVSGPHKLWADLLAAVATRNTTEIVARGTQLLAAPSSLTRDERTYLVSALATAHLRMGETPQARELLAAQWDELDHGGEFALTLRELQALAQAGGNPAFAHDRPTDVAAPGS